jgi:D-inositol-3-phosphate glycosyltransferase
MSMPIAKRELPAIAIIDSLGAHGGLHYYVHDQANALESLGHQMSVFALPASTDTRARYRKFDSFTGVYGSDNKLLRGIRLVWNLTSSILRSRAKKIPFVIFHIFKGNVAELYAVTLSRLLGMKTICVIHDIERLDTSAAVSLMSKICQNSNRLLVHNDFSESILLEKDPTLKSKTVIVPHGNYISQFSELPSSQQARATLNLPSDRFVLLFFGNPRHEKGLHILLEALTEAGQRDRVLLVIAGKLKPDMLEATTAYVKTHHLESSVRIDAGHVSDELVASYFRAADIVVLPYLRVYESGVALMSMTLGRPVIASELPPLVDAVGADGERGYLFPAGQSQKLAEQIDAAMQDSSGLQAKGLAAGEFARLERDWRRSAELTSAALS